MKDLQHYWYALFPADHFDPVLVNTFFNNLLKNYNSSKRHYHSAAHIINMLNLSDKYKAHLQQKDIVDLAIFYHDVIYNILKKDNEERSAKRAVRELQQLKFAKEKTDLIETYILATQKHDLQGFSGESDLAYFLDFDLAVLGADEATYATYMQNIRKEYHIYPDFMYNPGRVNVLQHFLQKPSIYYTNVFKEYQETQARINLQWELQQLQAL